MQILELVSECLAGMIKSMILYGLSGMVVGIILMIVGSRMGIFRRKHLLLKILVIIYFFYIPLVFGCTGGFVGATSSAEGFTKKQVHKTIQPLTKMSFPSYQLYLKFNWKKIVQTKTSFKQTVHDYLSFIQYEPHDGSWWESTKTSLANKVVPLVAEWGMEAVIHAAKKKAIKGTSDALGIQEESADRALEIARNIEIDQFKDDFWKIVEEETTVKIHSFYSGFYLTIALYFLLFMALPLVEIVASNIYLMKVRN